MAAQATPAQLRGQVEENLRQLGRDCLDLVNLRLSGLDSIAEHFGALAELRNAGLIRHLGVSNACPSTWPRPRQIAPVVCVQNPTASAPARQEPRALRECGEHGLALRRSSPLPEPGARPARAAPSPREVLAVAREHQAHVRRRYAWHGLCIAGRTYWSSRRHATPATSPTTSLPERCASRPATWPGLTQFTRTSSRPDLLSFMTGLLAHDPEAGYWPRAD